MMTLAELLRGWATPQGDAAVLPIQNVVIDSRQARPGSLFLAIPGMAADGHDFAAQAVAQGASAVLAQRDLPGLAAPVLTVPDTRALMPLLAARFYGHPADALSLIGVTGTNGKTTVTTLLEAIFNASGQRTGLMGTLGYRWSDHSLEAARTTPDALELHRVFRTMADDGVGVVVMEVSSHALALHRVDGLAFDAAVFTNLTRDHMDFHPTEADYLEAKLGLFRQLGDSAPAVINGDDPHSDSFATVAGNRSHAVGFGGQNAVQITSHEYRPQGSRFQIRHRGQIQTFDMPLWGRFNIVNAAQAVVTALELRLDPETIQRGLSRVERVPGRMDGFFSERGFRVLIDYAHTPDALQNVLTTVREMTRGRVAVVFGCGGDRDPGKRPQMGRIASELADLTVVTSDNPRSESPEAILEQILNGIDSGSSVESILDRRQAIGHALAWAREGDTVLIAGKGHETYQEVAGVRHPFDDREVALSILGEGA